jgi:hypothetical protein
MVGAPAFGFAGRSVKEKVVLVMWFTATQTAGEPEVANEPSAESLKAQAWAKAVAGFISDKPGHVINMKWGGPGKLDAERGIVELQETASFTNIVPLSTQANGLYQTRIEKRFRDLVKDHVRVCGKVRFEYPSGDVETKFLARPTKIMFEYWYWDGANNKYEKNPTEISFRNIG